MIVSSIHSEALVTKTVPRALHAADFCVSQFSIEKSLISVVVFLYKSLPFQWGLFYVDRL